MNTNDSIVLQLQSLASDGPGSISDLLRKAFVVATKLGIEDFRAWVGNELTGYHPAGKMPRFRVVPCTVVSADPRSGQYLPLHYKTKEARLRFSRTPVGNPIAEIEQMIVNDLRGECVCPMPPELLHELIQLDPSFELNPPVRVVPALRMKGIVDCVRTVVLEWSLRLEREGILGDGLTFSAPEKEKAATSQYVHIHNCTGVSTIGDLSVGSIQMNFGGMYQHLRDVGVPKHLRHEFEELSDSIESAEPEQKKSLLGRGLDWVAKNKDGLGAAAELTVRFFKSVCGVS